MADTEQATLTLTLTVTVKPEPNISVEDKEVNIKQVLSDQAHSIFQGYDWGIAVAGTLESSLTATENIDDSKPDYTEE